MTSNGLDLSSLIIARRLILNSGLAREDDKVKDPRQKKATALDHFNEDQVLISGQECRETCVNRRAAPRPENIDVKLSDLISRLKDLDSGEPQQAGQANKRTKIEAQVVSYTRVETEFTMEYHALERVDGLVLRDSQLAETDRYRFEFLTADRLRIVDKWSNRSTTIWGDPHIDVDDVEGTWDGDFKDMAGSNTHTTFMLLDGTRLTITALDDGIIESVDIYKDSQRVRGYGGASSHFYQGQQYFQQEPADLPASVPLGDVVKAGGDGNDWFTPGGSLLWGQTTGPIVTSRPSAVLQMSLRQEITQVIHTSVSVDTHA